MNANITKTVLGGLLPFITNPATLAVIGIGAVGLTVYEILTDKKEDEGNGSEPQSNGSEPLTGPFADGSAAVAGTVPERLKPADPTAHSTAHSTDEMPFTVEDGDCRSEDAEIIPPESAKKEMIRQAMSELGKRSAAARLAKKLAKNADNPEKYVN